MQAIHTALISPLFSAAKSSTAVFPGYAWTDGTPHRLSLIHIWMCIRDRGARPGEQSVRARFAEPGLAQDDQLPRQRRLGDGDRGVLEFGLE